MFKKGHSESRSSEPVEDHTGEKKNPNQRTTYLLRGSGVTFLPEVAGPGLKGVNEYKAGARL